MDRVAQFIAVQNSIVYVSDKVVSDSLVSDKVVSDRVVSDSLVSSIVSVWKDICSHIDVQPHGIVFGDFSVIEKLFHVLNNYAANAYISVSPSMTINDVITTGRELFKRKNADYGDAFAGFGMVGVVVRMGDKIARLESLMNSGKALVDESIADTLIDLYNYSIMVLILK